MRQQKQTLRYLIGLLLIIFIILVPFIRPFNDYLAIPNEIITFKNDLELPEINSSVRVATELTKTDVGNENMIDGQPVIYNINGLPIKKVNLSLLDDIHVIP